MLLKRVYEPGEDDILYHYCDANAFLSICTHKKLRLSDVYSMNDFLEMHWGYSIWEEVAGRLAKEIGEEFIERVDQLIMESGLFGTLTAACFSLDKDVLSQWRAYADDGKGYVIGFRAQDLVCLPVRPLKVQYNREEQVSEMWSIMRAFHDVETTSGMTFGKEFFEACIRLSFDLAAFKNPAFNEEKEVRLCHILDFEPSNDFLKLVDSGGNALGEPVGGLPVQFRMRENGPVAFIEQDFTNGGTINPIKEVIIGPKNTVRNTAILAFLETVGIGSVKVSRSEASYR